MRNETTPGAGGQADGLEDCILRCGQGDTEGRAGLSALTRAPV